MQLVFTEAGWQDYVWFQEQNRRLQKRVNLLIKDALRSPFEGIGKPESLKGELAGYWSRRINDEHRVVYSVKADDVILIACRFHYND